MRQLKILKFLWLFLFVFSAGFILLSLIQNGFQGPKKGFQMQRTKVSSALRDSDSRISEVLDSDSAYNERQTSRKALIKQFCDHDQRSHHNLSNVTSSLIASPRYKILYCLTPKCASRQFRRMLFRPRSLPKIKLKYLPKQEQTTVLETYFKFTFVREPLERLLSAYKDKFVYPRKIDRDMLKFHGRAILKEFRPSATRRALENLDDITFREFIQYLVTKGSNETNKVMDWHWDNYNNLCHMCDIEYDFIGHYETLEEDLIAFKQMVGNDFKFSIGFQSGVYNVSKTSSELLQYYSQIPLKWINDLGVIYKNSFEMFNYSFPGPLAPLFQRSRLKGIS